MTAATVSQRAWGTQRECADILGISITTMRKRVVEGLIRTQRLPGVPTKFSLADARRLAAEDFTGFESSPT